MCVYSLFLQRTYKCIHASIFSRSDPAKNLDLFQSGKLREKDEEWHLLVSAQAMEALGKDEVERQSIMFELIKAERDYVSDLETMRQV